MESGFYSNGSPLFYYLVLFLSVVEAVFCCIDYTHLYYLLLFVFVVEAGYSFNDCSHLYYLVLFVTVVEPGYCCNDFALLYYIVLFVTLSWKWLLLKWRCSFVLFSVIFNCCWKLDIFVISVLNCIIYSCL